MKNLKEVEKMRIKVEDFKDDDNDDNGDKEINFT